MNGDAPAVYLVDDDPSVLKALTRMLETEGFAVRAYSSPRAFLDAHDANMPGCVILDLAMPEIGGLDLQSRLVSPGYARPIVFITGHGDIPSSVSAMKAGAVDFLTKPFDDEDLLSAVREAIDRDKAARRSLNERLQFEERIASLTPRERQVFDQVILGRLNKQIASDLAIVEKTVKFHRARVMRKMGVKTVAELARLAGRLAPVSQT